GVQALAPRSATASLPGGRPGYAVVQGATSAGEQAAAIRYWTPARMAAALRGANSDPQLQATWAEQHVGPKHRRGHGPKQGPTRGPRRGPAGRAASRLRTLVKKAPPPVVPRGPWQTGDTAGQGLRWTHGGVVQGAVGKIFFTLHGTDFVCSGALVNGGRAA